MSPAPGCFDHLLRLTDDTGLLEHARGALPRRGCGYCVDDVARGLVAISREPDPSPALTRAGETYLAFLTHAQVPDGRCRNRLSYERRWEDEPALGDWWGRMLWSLGTATARHRDPWLRQAALAGFEQSAPCRSAYPRAMAFAALGGAEVLAVQPTHRLARELVVAAMTLLARDPEDGAAAPGWPWPEARLTYGNALLPEALLAGGAALGDDVLVTRGVALLDWLLGMETRGDHLSVTPAGGWQLGEPRPGFDQQPIEVAALADACARAYRLTGGPRWSEGVDLAASWFLGNNDAGEVMHDPATGGGYDGLHARGHNANQGAESTLALICTLQHSRRLVRSPL